MKNISRLFYTLTLLLIGFSLTSSLSADSFELTTDERQKIEEWVKNVSVDDGVGQLFMINMPIHFSKTRDSNPVHKTLLEEEGFGSIILQSSNFSYLKDRAQSEEERISIVTNFVNNMQYRALSSKHLKMPLFIAADFEGPRFNPIKSVLTPPPPSLTMATTQDPQLIGDTGKVVGYQLASSGINMILGPVLDIEESGQGTYNSLLKNRSFANSADGVSRVAAYYIKGLREAGITVIGKHFPGLGKIDVNPHASVSSFIGTEEDFKRQMSPYYALKDYLNGVMTSHIAIDFIDGKNPATISKKITGIIRNNNSSGIESPNYKNKLVITDDMGMGSITEYERSRSSSDFENPNAFFSNVDYSALAIDAFDSGHDIIMFAKVILESQKHRYEGSNNAVITVDEIIRVKDQLAAYIKSGNQTKFRESLQRIISAKAYNYKLHGGSVSNFLKGKMKKVINSRVIPPAIIKSEDGFIDTKKIENLHRQTIQNAYVLLQGTRPLISRFNQVNSCFFTGHQSSYQSLKTKYNRINISNSAHLREILDENETMVDYLRRIQQPIKDFLENKNCQQIYFEANEKEDIDRLINVIDFTKTEDNSIYVLLHQTPVIIPKSVSDNSKVSIMGAFTTHQLSYPLDVQMIKGDFTPNENPKLTIDYQQKQATLDIAKPEAGKPKFDYDIDSAKNVTDELIIIEQEERIDELKNEIEDIYSDVKTLTSDLKGSLIASFEGQAVQINKLVPASFSQGEKYLEIIGSDAIKEAKSMSALLSVIEKNIDDRQELTALEKLHYKLLSFLSIREVSLKSADGDDNKSYYGYYTSLLIILMSITTLLILLYIIEFCKQDILNTTSLKNAILVLLKRLFTRPQLLMIMILLACMMVLFIARLKQIPVGELMALYFKSP